MNEKAANMDPTWAQVGHPKASWNGTPGGLTAPPSGAGGLKAAQLANMTLKMLQLGPSWPIWDPFGPNLGPLLLTLNTKVEPESVRKRFQERKCKKPARVFCFKTKKLCKQKFCASSSQRYYVLAVTYDSLLITYYYYL